MGRKVNMKIQMHQQIDNKLAIGVSRHNMKQEYKNHCKQNNITYNAAKSPFIHSISTASSYRQTINEFSSWLKDSKTETWATKDLSTITKDVAYQYLKERELEGKSAWTVTKDMSAINKVLDLGLNKKEGKLQQRRLEDITRSRGPRENDLKYNEKNYLQQIEFSKAFGLRRESISSGKYAVKESSLFIKNNNIYVSVIEKGGRYREAQCLDKYKSIIQSSYNIKEHDGYENIHGYDKASFIEDYTSSKDDILFDKYTAKIDNHAFRSEYAQELYEQLATAKDDLKDDYYGYDAKTIREVSEALGHSRLDVVVKHYL